MNQLDVYYRALLNYRVLTAKSRECTAFRKAVAQADTENDQIRVTRFICTVDEEWIEEIEKGLVFIEKAIKEERQFIYSNGEVVPIEKVKHVSRESVQHLAKHSDMITRVEEGEDLIPDKLYSIERLNDYAVYENRFLYMLLCYLRDFVTIRYDKILEFSNKYDGKLSISKQLVLPKQKIEYRVELHDERKDDRYLREHNSSKDIIDRIDLILKTVLAFLSTPLMECAAKAAMLKPPITKTNVLKMDNNFKGAVALYDFIIAYDKDGYTTEEQVSELSPFGTDQADEIAEACAMLTFLTYQHGLGITSLLKNRYDAAEHQRREDELKQRSEQLESLKRRLAKSEIAPAEYILELEKQVKLLEADHASIEPLHRRIDELKENEVRLHGELDECQLEIKSLNNALFESAEEHRKEMELVRAEYDERIHEVLSKHEEELQQLEQSYLARIEELKQDIVSIKEKCKEDLNAANEEMELRLRRIEELTAECDAVKEERLLCQARIKALRAQLGLMDKEDDYTDKAAFTQLEKEFAAFERFYRGQWDAAKKKIRRSMLGYQNLKKRSQRRSDAADEETTTPDDAKTEYKVKKDGTGGDDRP